MVKLNVDLKNGQRESLGDALYSSTIANQGDKDGRADKGNMFNTVSTVCNNKLLDLKSDEFKSQDSDDYKPFNEDKNAGNKKPKVNI